jgi:hypothetical protein
MRTLPIVIVLASSACVSISDEQLAERQAGYPFEVSVLGVTPELPVACEAVDTTLEVAVSTSMAGATVVPTLSVLGAEPVQLPAQEVPADGAMQLVTDAPLPCDDVGTDGLCSVDVEVSLSTSEGATASTSAVVQRIPTPRPELVRSGVLEADDGGALPELVEGPELAAALDDGALDVSLYPTLYAVVDDPSFAHLTDDERGDFSVVVCPDGEPVGSLDCLTLPSTGGLDLPVAPSAKVLAVGTEPIAELLCGQSETMRFYAAYIDNVCGDFGAVEILQPMRLQGDCDDDGAYGDDCDDADPQRFPGNTELCNGVDDDCDEVVPSDEVDDDIDGYLACEECDDAAYDTNPGAAEACNGIDDDCDGSIDEELLVEAWVDADGDGLGDPSKPVSVCSVGKGQADNADDCDDANALASQPMLEPHCPDDDLDLAGTADETLWEDHCPGEQPTGWRPWFQCTDCDDSASGGQTALLYCEPTDDDGDGVISAGLPRHAICTGDDTTGLLPPEECADCDDGDPTVTVFTWYLDGDGDGFGNPSISQSACQQPLGYVANGDDCDDGDPGLGADGYLDADGDGFGAPGTECMGTATNDDDCDDGNFAIQPGRWSGDYTDAAMLSTWQTGTLADALGNAVTNTVTICGTFDGAEWTDVHGVRTLQGLGGNSVLLGDGASTVLLVDRSSDVAIRDLAIIGGGGTQGGGLRKEGSGDLTLDNVFVGDNVLTNGEGGGLWIGEGHVEVSGAVLEGNQASLGAGVYVGLGASLRLVGSIVRDNHSFAEGGGVATRGSVTIDAGSFTGNSADGDLPGAPAPVDDAGSHVAVIGPAADLTSGNVAYESLPDGILTRGEGSPGNPPAPAPQAYDPTTLPASFVCDETGC